MKETSNIEDDKPRIVYPTEYFVDNEIGVFRTNLESWLEFLYKARDLKEHRSGGNLTAIYIDEGIVYISYLYGGGGPEILPLERLISFIESRLPGLEYDIK
jgi:hypothetical protein